MSILVLDLGTTYFKAGVFAHEGELLALHREVTPVEHPQAERWEIPTAGFVASIHACLQGLRGQRAEGLSDIEAITFATQTNSFLLLDAGGQPLTPLILWPDARAQEFDPQVAAIASAPGFLQETGLPALGHEFMAAKLLWLREHQPETWSRLSRVCLISDYLTFLLTGRHATEAGAAGLTGLVDIHALRWRAAMLEALALNEASLPTIVRAGTEIGAISHEAAAQFGLPESCRMIVGCLDQYAGAIGTGNVESGNLSETTGTVLATVRCADHCLANPPDGVYQGPAFDAGRYFHFCFGTTSAGLLEWYRNSLSERPDYATLEAEAAGVPPGADGVRAVPDGMQVRFEGLAAARGRGHATRAIMETVAFALAGQVERLCPEAAPSTIRASGGAARSDLWLQIKADVLGLPVATGACEEPTCLGAAMLAGRALGWGALPELAQRWIRSRRTCEPNAARHALYEDLRKERAR